MRDEDDEAAAAERAEYEAFVNAQQAAAYHEWCNEQQAIEYEQWAEEQFRMDHEDMMTELDPDERVGGAETK